MKSGCTETTSLPAIGRKLNETEQTFGATLVAPSAGTPEGPWLRTGDLGFISDGELFIIGRIKDLLIVYGRNHSPDDLEATIQSIAPGRCAAISVPDEGTEKLVAIIEFKNRAASTEDGGECLRRRQTQSHLCDIQRPRTRRRGSRCGSAWFDSHHHQRQGQKSGLCRAVSAESVRPLGRLALGGPLHRRLSTRRTLWGRNETPEHAAHRNGAHLGCRASPHGPQRFPLPLRNPPGASTAASARLPTRFFCSRTSIPRASSILTSPIT